MGCRSRKVRLSKRTLCLFSMPTQIVNQAVWFYCCFFLVTAELVENDDLISLEKFEPTSPETWPEKSKTFANLLNADHWVRQRQRALKTDLVLVPGINEFAKMNAITTREEIPSWTQGLSQEDINSMHRKRAYFTKSRQLQAIRRWVLKANTINLCASGLFVSF